MKKIVDIVVRFIRVGRRVYTRKWSFLWLFAVAFLGSVSVLAQADLLPEAPLIVVEKINTPAPAVAVTVSELPTKIEISHINLSANIMNPTTTNIAALDTELLKGAVRYPTSAKLGEMGNVVLFAHSSYIPVVGNQAYKAFNNIQKLAVGDIVTVYSVGTAYTYSVRSVVKEVVDNNAGIPLSVTGKVLTLVTCNSFTDTKQDRFVLTADFVESHLISV